MAALTIKGPNGMTAITYVGSIKLEIQAVGNVSITRYGLGEGDVKWRCPTSLATKLSPALRIQHPVLPWLTMEKLQLSFDKDYTDIDGHFAGAYPGGDPTYDYQPSFGQEPIQSHPNFGTANSVAGDGTIVGSAGGNFLAGGFVVFNPDTSFSKILSMAPNNLGGVASYLLAQGFYVKSYVDVNAPDCSQDGTITSPDGGSIPTIPPGANWLQAPTVFQQRAGVYDIRRSWKASGRKGVNPIIYAAIP